MSKINSLMMRKLPVVLASTWFILIRILIFTNFGIGTFKFFLRGSWKLGQLWVRDHDSGIIYLLLVTGFLCFLSFCKIPCFSRRVSPILNYAVIVSLRRYWHRNIKKIFFISMVIWNPRFLLHDINLSIDLIRILLPLSQLSCRHFSSNRPFRTNQLSHRPIHSLFLQTSPTLISNHIHGQNFPSSLYFPYSSAFLGTYL